MIDYTITYSSNCALLTPLSPRAQEYVTSLSVEPWQRLGKSVGLPLMRGRQVVQALQDRGLVSNHY